MTVAELLARITSAELTEWYALARIEAAEHAEEARRSEKAGQGTTFAAPATPAGPPQWGLGAWQP